MKPNRVLIFTLFSLLTQVVFSQSSLHFTPEFFHEQQFAHRGGDSNGAENTLKTILHNIQLGVTCVEIDVQLTKDNELVVFHDDTIHKLLQTENKKLVRSCTLEEMKEFPLRNEKYGTQYVCSLNELIDTLAYLIPHSTNHDFILEIDFKPSGGNDADVAILELTKIIDRHIATFGEELYNYFFVSTFYPKVLKKINALHRPIKTSFALLNNPAKKKFKCHLAIILAPYFVKKHAVAIIEPNMCMITERFVRKWDKRNVLILTYTADTKCEKEYLKNFKVAVTTNCPDNTCQEEKSEFFSTKKKKWCKKCN